MGVHDPLISPRPYYRHFSFFVPGSYDSSRPHSLFLDFHGFDDLAQLQAREDGLFKAAEKEGFLVAYPKGMADVVYDAYTYTYYYYFNSWNGGGSNGTEGEYGSVCDGYKHAFYPCPTGRFFFITWQRVRSASGLRLLSQSRAPSCSGTLRRHQSQLL